MQVKELKQDGLSYEMQITIPANDIDARIDVKLQEVGQTVRMPGFRPGKVPMDILKKRYGRAVMGEVLEAAVNETSKKALDNKKLKPALQPKIEVKEFDEGKDLVYTVEVEVLPEFDVGDFKGLKLEKAVAKPDDKAIRDALAKLAENRETTQPVTTKRATKDGDTVVIDFKGRTADDNVEHAGMAAEGHSLKLGSGNFIPGFEEQLIGKKAEDDVEVKVGFPENYGAQELAGREAIFDVKIHEIRELGETKIDDEFAKSFGLEGLDALKKAVEEQLEAEFGNQSRLIVKRALMDALDESYDFEVPQGMLDIEYENIIQQVELDRQRNESKKELTDKEKDEYKQISERRVRLGLILSEVGKSNSIQVSDAELQQMVISEAQKYPGQEKDVFEYYSKNVQALESLRAPMFEDKVVDYILELANVTEKSVSPEALIEILDSEEEYKPKKKAAKSSKTKASQDKKPAAKKAPAKKKIDAAAEKPKAKKTTKAKKAS